MMLVAGVNMASIYRHGAGWRAQLYFRGQTLIFWIGKCSKTQATNAAAHLEQLKIARNSGGHPPADTRHWLATVAKETRDRLEFYELIDPQPNSKFRRTLGDFCQDYIDSRDDWQGSRPKNMTNVRRHMISQLGEDTLLSQVTPGEAKRFARWARKTFAHSHSGKLIRDATQFFAAAVDERIIPSNPFAGIESSQKHDTDKDAYVSAADIDKLIKAQDDPYYKAVIAATRYAGLRNPSELQCLHWDTIDFDSGRMHVDSPKTGLRVCPIFGRFRPYLSALYIGTDSGEGPFRRHRTKSGAASRHFKMMDALFEKVEGITRWPKLWHTLRRSCIRDLEAEFPEHVVCKWLGNSPTIKRKHYDVITDEDYERACSVG